MRSRSPTSSSLKEFAEAPGAYLDVAPGTKIFDRERYHASVAAAGRYVNATRLRFDPADAADVLEEVTALAPSGTGSWITPSRELARALLNAGAREPEQPLLPTFTALATEREPPAVEGIEVRRVETYSDFLRGLEIELASGGFTEDRAAR